MTGFVILKQDEPYRMAGSNTLSAQVVTATLRAPTSQTRPAR